MRLERFRRWHWVVLSLVVGLGLAQARQFDAHDLLNRLGDGFADRGWFEREVQRQVTLADGSSVPAFGRLRVYPLSVRERGGRRQVHVVAGMYLTHVPDGRGGAGGGGAGGASAVGRIRPCFFIAPVPYQSLGDERAGKPVDPGGTVRRYLDGLRAKGVTYTYAWWADSRYAAAAWVGGSFALVGVLWPTALNLLVYGTFGAPREEKGVSLWKVRPAHLPPPRDAVKAAVAGMPVAGNHCAISAKPPPQHGATAPQGASRATTPVLSVAPADDEVTAATPGHEHKEFGARRDDFYPTELKAAPRRTDPVHG
jgi:hypothetical protein